MWPRNQGPNGDNGRAANGRPTRPEASGDLHRRVDPWPVGFDEQDALEAQRLRRARFDHPELKVFLSASEPGNEVQDYTFAAAQWAEDHVVLVVRRRAAEGKRPDPLVEPAHVEPERRVEVDDNVRIIHLHYKERPQAGQPRVMQVSQHTLFKTAQLKNYVELVRLRTTPRALLVALFHVYPTRSSILLSDCAQFAIRFLNELARCTRFTSDHMSKAEFDAIIKELPQFIHVREGSVGRSETESRGTMVESDQSENQSRDLSRR
ncbi:hypothetical protein PG993_005789 [Apiospora rasikravindrae]|uniref:Uncharacterized protein n=1 Tax=Apiospora rasikravindrae TaxID=990691 RepID=A0ABR1T9S5_9PEZI